jgi:hypothetical protein
MEPDDSPSRVAGWLVDAGGFVDTAGETGVRGALAAVEVGGVAVSPRPAAGAAGNGDTVCRALEVTSTRVGGFSQRIPAIAAAVSKIVATPIAIGIAFRRCGAEVAAAGGRPPVPSLTTSDVRVTARLRSNAPNACLVRSNASALSGADSSTSAAAEIADS